MLIVDSAYILPVDWYNLVQNFHKIKLVDCRQEGQNWYNLHLVRPPHHPPSPTYKILKIQ